MSEVRGGVLLLLLGLLYLGTLWPVQGALLVSRYDATTKETRGAIRSIQKRSVDDAKMVEVLSVTVHCTVASRFAHTVMTSSALNKANSSQEIFFEVDLPKTAFITNFSMEIEGQIYVGVVNEKEKAKRQYEKAVSSGRTAGLVKASGRKMEKFFLSVNIAAKSNVTFILTYEELLQRKFGKYEILTRINPKQLVENFQIVADIYEPQGIAFVDAHATFLSNELLPLVEKTVTDNKAHISFSPTLDQQRKCPECDGSLINGDFIIKYDVKRASSLGDIQIVNGYFVHFFAPPDLPHLPKNVVFVIDRSGSMSGTKMKQTRVAMESILSDVHPEDYFGIILFDGIIDLWKESLTKATEENVDEAIKFVRQISSRGSTNINDSVMKAIHMLQDDRRNKKLPERSVDMIILLTDGMPNTGESNLQRIQQNVCEAIGGNMTLFCLGFGEYVDYSFLDVMAKQNNGVARRIYEASDATLQLQGFYDEVASPLLSAVDLRYPDNAVDSLTPHHFSQLFNGSEIVVAGRLSENDMDNFLVEVFANGFEQDFQVQGEASVTDWDVIYPEKDYIFGDFTERLWAYLTIQQLLETSKSGPAEKKSNATAKALEMSLKYSFVTPLTSMVVTKAETEDGPSGPLIADKLTEGATYLHSAPQTRSYMITAVAHHPTYFVDGDPHFMIELPEKEDALCFNINDSPGTIFNLVKDPSIGLLVNGQTIGDKMVAPDGKVNTYFGRLGVVHHTLGVRLEVTTEYITLSQDGQKVKLLWSDQASLKGPSVDLLLTKDRSVKVTLRDSVKFVILLHKVWKMHPYHQDYLGFYTLDSHLLSPSVHGLLGQFYHGIEFEVGDLRPGEVPEKPDATMYVKGHQLNVTRGWQRDFRKDLKKGENVPCWFIHSNGTGLIDGSAEDYIVSGLFNTV
ncbi:inter-alpha-trypsin inhibitor heavy chain H3-like isoform X2 [Gadus chalcogrammus]|uniref:inter-alpha-trypsin inhibitor heavy chain H3-like isoform X2 n=1 Tax=Gadus chalcogrammus TaxID=1042646 RepID=UPI0024C4891E|nr:inter-alpha-trypsin inhibitor heavy chain H3-like isoform X2 [Gadus chalcogrammus]